MYKEVQLEWLGHLPCLEASNYGKKSKSYNLKRKILDLSIDQYFGRISLLKNPINSRLDGLEPWLKYLQLSSF